MFCFCFLICSLPLRTGRPEKTLLHSPSRGRSGWEQVRLRQGCPAGGDTVPQREPAVWTDHGRGVGQICLCVLPWWPCPSNLTVLSFRLFIYKVEMKISTFQGYCYKWDTYGATWLNWILNLPSAPFGKLPNGCWEFLLCWNAQGQPPRSTWLPGDWSSLWSIMGLVPVSPNLVVTELLLLGRHRHLQDKWPAVPRCPGWHQSEQCMAYASFWVNLLNSSTIQMYTKINMANWLPTFNFDCNNYILSLKDTCRPLCHRINYK